MDHGPRGPRGVGPIEQTIEQLVSQQTALITSILNDSIAQTKALSSQTDFTAAVESQKSFNEALQAKVSDSAKEAYAVVTIGLISNRLDKKLLKTMISSAGNRNLLRLIGIL